MEHVNPSPTILIPFVTATEIKILDSGNSTGLSSKRFQLRRNQQISTISFRAIEDAFQVFTERLVNCRALP
jgi:hypothetical protein